VIAYLNLGNAWVPLTHYVVVVGFDDQRQGVYVHSGLKEATFMPYRKFLSDWKKTGDWALEVHPSSATVAVP
jgi:hypothetical protein